MDSIEPGAESDSPTDTQAEQSTDAATVKDTPTPKDLLSQMESRLDEVKRDDADEAEEAEPAKDAKATAKAKDEKADRAKDAKADGDKPEAKAKPEKPDSVPMAAFEKRVGKLTEQKRALQNEVAAAKLETAKTTAALKIAAEELERYRELAREAGAFDEKDEQIRTNDVRERARAEKARVDQEHQQLTATFTDQETRAANAEQLQAEMDEALASNHLLDFDMLKTLLGKPENLVRPVAEVAAEYQARVLKAAGVQTATTAATVAKPPSPKTVKARSNGNAAARHPANHEGLEARMAELKAIHS